MPVINIQEEIIDPGTPDWGFNQSFLVGDWADNGDDQYVFPVYHSLNTNNIVSQVYEDSEEVYLHRKRKESNNEYRLYVTKDPDARFNGIIHCMPT